MRFEDESQEKSKKDLQRCLMREELKALDIEASKIEEECLEKMGVLQKLKEGEQEEEGSYILTSKMVVTWKYRDEKGGWFRRARL